MTTDRSPQQALVHGAGAGVVASLAMAMYAMFAAWEKGTGFFTPLYHIASLTASDHSMTASMKAAMAGSDFHFVLGTAVVGAMIHMMTGAMYGAIFGLVVSRFDLGLGVLGLVGVAYGAMVFALSSWVGLPLAAAVFGSGDPIRSMAEMAGWGTFVVEHLLFGLALGVVLAGLFRRAVDAQQRLAHAHAG